MAELAIDDPYTLKVAVRRPLADENAVERLLEAAAAAARRFAAVPVEERVALCRRAVAGMREEANRIAADITLMMGKPVAQARREVETMAARAEHMPQGELADALVEEAWKLVREEEE